MGGGAGGADGAGQEFVDLASGGAGAGDEVAHDVVELALAFSVVALDFLCADDGVGVDGEVDGGLADGGELIAGLEHPEGDAVAHLLD